MDRIELGALVRAYGLHSRSLRVFRGLGGNGVLVVVIGPCVALLFLPFVSHPVYAVLLVGVLLGAMGLGLMAIATYESLAACSLFAIRSTIVVVVALAASRLAVVGDALADAGWRWQVTLPVAMGLALNLMVLWLIVRGLLTVAWRDRDFERDLFRVRVRERPHFFLPFAGLVRDMCRMAGLVVPPHCWRPDRVTASAALAAFALEGAVYYTYLQAGFNLSKHARELAASNFPVGIAVAFVLLGPPITLAIGRAFFSLSRRLRVIALRRSLATAAELQRDDVRAPVLFLRSFRDDQVDLADAPIPFALKFFDPGVEVRTLEGLVVRTMTPIGPVIAIGNPTDERPPLGAARNYLQSADWQVVVSSLIAEARVVVVGLDETAGVRWELSELAARGALCKTVVVVPPVSAEVQQRYLDSMAEAVGRPSSQACNVGRNTIAVLFDDRDRVASLVSRKATEIEYDVAMRMAVRWILVGDRLTRSEERSNQPNFPAKNPEGDGRL